MLFRKTPTNERGNYVYRFNDGTVSVIAEGSEAEVWIKSLLPLMMRKSTTTLRTAGRSLKPGRRKRWKSGRRSIREKSLRRTGTCLWTG
jgi:hypothetical protein